MSINKQVTEYKGYLIDDGWNFAVLHSSCMKPALPVLFIPYVYLDAVDSK